MKTKFLWVALLASAALIAQAQAGGYHGGGGGGGGGGGHFAASHAAPARGGAGPSFRSMPMRSFDGGRMMYSGQRFSSNGMRPPSSAAFRQHAINSNGSAFTGTRQFTAGNSNRGNHLTRSSNQGNRAIANFRRDGNGAGQTRRGNNLPANWRNHVFAQHSGNWHRDWDRGREHWWNGHRCRFINGSWFIFDFGFYPWWPWYPDYYGYDYYPYPYSYAPSVDYDSGVYQGEEYYGQDRSDSSDEDADSTVAAAQERLARQGYYRGGVDGVLGPATRRAIVRYQSQHGLRVTGYLTTDTLEALGLRQVASD